MDRKAPNRETEDALEAASSRPVQRWPAILAMLVIVAAYSVVSEKLTPVTRLMLPAFVVVGILLILLARMRGRHLVVRPIALVLIGAITLAEFVSTLLLVSILPRGGIAPTGLLQDAALIWIINVVTFALWYWEIVGDGPLMRRQRQCQASDFLFPQQANPQQANPQQANTERGKWSPEFID